MKSPSELELNGRGSTVGKNHSIFDGLACFLSEIGSHGVGGITDEDHSALNSYAMAVPVPTEPDGLLSPIDRAEVRARIEESTSELGIIRSSPCQSHSPNHR